MPSVLFVCTANQFRSPLAAAFFKKALEENEVSGSWRVDSAGTWATPGLTVPPSVSNVARRFGLDLSGHRSARVSASLLQDHDLILVMQASQKEALQGEFPSVREHIYLLSEVLERRSYDIPDVSGSGKEMERISADLNALIRRGLERICVLAIYLYNTKHRTEPHVR